MHLKAFNLVRFTFHIFLKRCIVLSILIALFWLGVGASLSLHAGQSGFSFANGTRHETRDASTSSRHWRREKTQHPLLKQIVKIAIVTSFVLDYVWGTELGKI